jgi:hypothetical protein
MGSTALSDLDTSLTERHEWAEICESLWQEDVDCEDEVDLLEEEPLKITILQWASLRSDELFVKEVVKLGAALDFPCTRTKLLHQIHFIPKGSTELHICCLARCVIW